MADYDLVGSIAEFGVANQGNNPKTLEYIFDFDKEFKAYDPIPANLAIADTVQLIGLPKHSILLAANYQVVIPTTNATAVFDLGVTGATTLLATGVAATAASQTTVVPLATTTYDPKIYAAGTKIVMTVATAAITRPFRLKVSAVIYSFLAASDEVEYGN